MPETMESEAQHVASRQEARGVASECSPTSLSPEKYPLLSPSSAREIQMDRHIPDSPQLISNTPKLPTAGVYLREETLCLNNLAEQSSHSSSSAILGTGLLASDRDLKLAQANQDKVHNCAKAWEDHEKAKVINKYHKKISRVTSWENSKIAALEAALKKEEENLHKQKLELQERGSNIFSDLNRSVDQKKADLEAARVQEILEVEQNAAKYRAMGRPPAGTKQSNKVNCCGFGV